MHNKGLIVAISSVALTREEVDLLLNQNIKGVLLLSHNIINPEQLRCLINSIRNIRSEAEFLISADFEVKSVWRAPSAFKDILPKPVDSMLEVARDYREKAYDLFYIYWYEYAYSLGRALVSFGININYSPVLDSYYEHSNIIGQRGRAFDIDADVILHCARPFLKGFKDAGLITNVKHYPDHGYAVNDTHISAAYDSRSRSCLMRHLEIYKSLIAEELVDSVMMSHVLYPEVDNQIASRSKIWHDILKNEIGFNGLVISDCMSMKGSGNDSLSSKLSSAFNAGTDIVILAGFPAGHVLHNNYPLLNYEQTVELLAETLPQQSFSP